MLNISHPITEVANIGGSGRRIVPVHGPVLSPPRTLDNLEEIGPWKYASDGLFRLVSSTHHQPCVISPSPGIFLPVAAASWAQVEPHQVPRLAGDGQMRTPSSVHPSGLIGISYPTNFEHQWQISSTWIYMAPFFRSWFNDLPFGSYKIVEFVAVKLVEVRMFGLRSHRPPRLHAQGVASFSLSSIQFP